MTTPIGGTGTTPPATAPAAKAKADSGLGPDAFMKLLVAQLKYQNPMAPADGQAYMTQMATFTQVEKLDQLVKAQTDALRWQQRVSAEGLVGRSVTGTVEGVLVTGDVVGLRYAGGNAVLELADGRTLDAALVERVRTAGATDTPPPTGSGAPAGTAPASSSTTAPAAGTPSP